MLGGCGANAASNESTEESGADALVFPGGPAPKKVVIKDLEVGHGAPLEPGDYISANFVAYDYDTEEVLEKHWGPSDTFGGTWGRDAGFIEAWEIGLRGMRAGGERELITPGKFVHGGPPRVYLMKMVEIIRVPDPLKGSTDEPSSSQPPDWTPLEKAAGKQADRLLIPRDRPPKKIVIKDLRVGDGPVLRLGDRFSAKYIALRYLSGEVREDRWDDNGPSTVFEYGEKAMVDGWVHGLKGMRFGGRRELILPGRWAYGLPLVYVIELRKPEEAKQAG